AAVSDAATAFGPCWTWRNAYPYCRPGGGAAWALRVGDGRWRRAGCAPASGRTATAPATRSAGTTRRAGLSGPSGPTRCRRSLPTVPTWPEFLRGCLQYRQSLDEQLPDAPGSDAPYEP